MKKRIAAILILILIFLLCSVSVFSLSDNPEAVFLSEKGIMVGSDGDLMLDQNFTIEQLMTVLARLAGKEDEAKSYSPENNFKDVPPKRWSAPYIAWARANGISKGNPDGTIGYSDNVTAQRLAAFVLRTLGYKDVLWTDVWNFSKMLGLIDIDGLEPADAVIRGDVAKIIYAALNTPTKGGEKLGVILGIVEGSGKEKTLEPAEISKLTSPAVVYIEIFDEANNITGSGSGFIVTKDGKVVTNYHVIDGAYSAKIKLIDGRSFDVAKVLGYDYFRDVAVLQVNATDLSCVKLGDSDKAVNGEKILTIGSPIGLENTISDGLISNKSRGIDEMNFIQISAPISSGSSGGALLNYNAEVIGITTAMFLSGQNLNLAIPINDVKPYFLINENLTLSELAQKAANGTIRYEDAVYSGEILKRIPHGQGTIVWSEGDMYVGAWENGRRTGEGIYTWPDGDYYIGHFKSDAIDGFGTYYWINGDQYAGEWKNDMMNGTGTMTFAGGTVLSGQWVDDVYQSGLSGPSGARAYAASTSEIDIGWDQLEGADYYYIYYSDSPTGYWYFFCDDAGNKSPQEWMGDYSSTLTGCPGNTTYYFKITAVINGVETQFSDVVSATTKSDN